MEAVTSTPDAAPASAQNLPASLPGGWRIDRDLTDHAGQAVLRRFAVSRTVPSGAGEAQERATVWVVDPAETSDAERVRRDVLDRAAKLRATRLPYVLAVRDAGLLPDGRVYVVEEWGGDPLPPALPKRLSGADAGAAFEHVLEGLAALHAAGLAHGSLVPNRVVGDVEHGDAWIAGTATGGVPFASGQAYLPPEIMTFVPADGSGSLRTPSESADVYAAGALASRFGEATKAASLKTAGERLRSRQVPDGGKALAAHRRHKADANRRGWRRWAIAGGVVAAILLGLGVWQFVTARKTDDRLATRTKEKETAERARDGVASELDYEKEQGKEARRGKADAERQRDEFRERLGTDAATAATTIKKLNERIAELTGVPPPPPTPQPTPLELAKAAWPAVLKRADADEKNRDWPLWWERLLVAAVEAEAEPAARPVLEDWTKGFRDVGSRFAEWLPHDATLRTLAGDAAGEPWDADARLALAKRLAALNKGAGMWQTWAFDSGMTWPRVKDLIAAEPDAELQNVLKGWQKETLAKDKWLLRLLTGTAPPGYATERTVAVGHDGSWPYQDPPYSWKSPTSHKYPAAGPTAFAWFDWSPDNTLGVYLYGERSWKKSWKRWELIDNSETAFRGPLAIWRMNAVGEVSQDGAKLTFEVVDCPGPPKELSEGLAARALEQVSQ